MRAFGLRKLRRGQSCNLTKLPAALLVVVKHLVTVRLPFLLADAGYVCQLAAHSCEHAGGLGGGLRFGNRRLALETTIARPVWASGTLEHDRFEATVNFSLQVLKW